MTVSVIVPCHNAEEYLAEALQSVREQTLRDLECIVVDDSSTDGSVAIAKRFAKSDPRFKLIASRERRGTSAARNSGIAKAGGQWVALLDADDLFVRGRLEVLTGIGEAENADLIFDDQLITDYPASDSRQRAFGSTTPQFGFTQEDFFSRSRLFRRSFPIGYMKPLMKRDFLGRTGVTYDPAVLSGEDFLFYAQLFSRQPRCIGTSFAGYVYRRRRGSLSRSDELLHFQAQLGDRILDEFGPQLSARSRCDLAGRRRDFENVVDAMPAIRAVRERNWVALVATLIKHPGVAATGIRLSRTRAARSFSAMR